MRVPLLARECDLALDADLSRILSPATDRKPPIRPSFRSSISWYNRSFSLLRDVRVEACAPIIFCSSETSCRSLSSSAVCCAFAASKLLERDTIEPPILDFRDRDLVWDSESLLSF